MATVIQCSKCGASGRVDRMVRPGEIFFCPSCRPGQPPLVQPAVGNTDNAIQVVIRNLTAERDRAVADIQKLTAILNTERRLACGHAITLQHVGCPHCLEDLKTEVERLRAGATTPPCVCGCRSSKHDANGCDTCPECKTFRPRVLQVVREGE